MDISKILVRRIHPTGHKRKPTVDPLIIWYLIVDGFTVSDRYIRYDSGSWILDPQPPCTVRLFLIFSNFQFIVVPPIDLFPAYFESQQHWTTTNKEQEDVAHAGGCTRSGPAAPDNPQPVVQLKRVCSERLQASVLNLALWIAKSRHRSLVVISCDTYSTHLESLREYRRIMSLSCTAQSQSMIT